jgi:hypothetical protein
MKRAKNIIDILKFIAGISWAKSVVVIKKRNRLLQTKLSAKV